MTDIPGTTRDAVSEEINILGVPLKITDTAGIRDTGDIIEEMGVKKSKELAKSSDLLIFVLDGSRPLESEDLEILSLSLNKKSIVIINKNDLDLVIDKNVINNFVDKRNIIEVSALKDEGSSGIGKLLENLIGDMFSIGEIDAENAVISSQRNLESQKNALKSLEKALETIDSGLFGEFISIDLKDAYSYLSEITGETYDEDLINKIFSEFCLGK